MGLLRLKATFSFFVIGAVEIRDPFCSSHSLGLEVLDEWRLDPINDGASAFSCCSASNDGSCLLDVLLAYLWSDELCFSSLEDTLVTAECEAAARYCFALEGGGRRLPLVGGGLAVGQSGDGATDTQLPG
ncbi:hypothetical protein HAX54_014829 [Datura stramonium]|uniref:Secreted protein n=1 Tax=Datura stramonium TaxID=4076 RepID=A0ABS8Y4Z0_DATST|nr:hypothetical protein [Datura stramonium]